MLLRQLMMTSSVLVLCLSFSGGNLFATNGDDGSGKGGAPAHVPSKKSLADLDQEIEALRAQLKEAEELEVQKFTAFKKAEGLAEQLNARRSAVLMGRTGEPLGTPINPIASPPAVIALLEEQKKEEAPAPSKPTPTPAKNVEVKPAPTPAPAPAKNVEVKPAPTPAPAPAKNVEVKPAPTPAPTPAKTVEVKPAPTPAPTPAKTVEVKPEPTPTPAPAKTVEVKPAPTPAPTPAKTVEVKPAPTPAPTPAKTVEVKPEPTPLSLIDKPTEKLKTIKRIGGAAGRKTQTRQSVAERQQAAAEREQAAAALKARELEALEVARVAALKAEEERVAAEKLAQAGASPVPSSLPPPAKQNAPRLNVLGGSALKSTGKLPLIVPEEKPSPSPAPQTSAGAEELPAVSEEIIDTAKSFYRSVVNRKKEAKETDEDVKAEAQALFGDIVRLGDQFERVGLFEFASFVNPLLFGLKTGHPAEIKKDYESRKAFLTNLEEVKDKWRSPQGLRRWRDILALDDAHRRAMFENPGVYGPDLFSNEKLENLFKKADLPKLSQIAQNKLFPQGPVTDELLEKYLEIPGMKLNALIQNQKALAILRTGGPKAEKIFEKMKDPEFKVGQIKTWDPEKAATDEQIPSPSAAKPTLLNLTQSLPPMRFGTPVKPKETPEQKAERLVTQKTEIEKSIGEILGKKNAFQKRASIATARESLNNLQKDFNDPSTRAYVKGQLDNLKKIEDALN